MLLEFFSLLAKADVIVDIISQSSPIDGLINISFTTSKEDSSSVLEVLNKIKKGISFFVNRKKTLIL